MIDQPQPRMFPVLSAQVAAACTALTASTNVCGLVLNEQIQGESGYELLALFQPGMLYPHLRCIDFIHSFIHSFMLHL
jgi:hypothetical protein